MNDPQIESKETPLSLSPDLNLKVEELQKLCAELDPFKKISKKHQKILKKYGLNEIEDPYLLSNHLISLTENALTEQLLKMNKTEVKKNDGITDPRAH